MMRCFAHNDSQAGPVEDKHVLQSLRNGSEEAACCNLGVGARNVQSRVWANCRSRKYHHLHCILQSLSNASQNRDVHSDAVATWTLPTR